jgi:septation ring formation regulator EzrA
VGAWQKELERVLAQSEKNKKHIEESTAYYQKVVDAAQAFTSAYTKAAPQFGKTSATLLDLAEEAGHAAGELSVLEDDLEAAKKDNNKAEVKKIEAKMKPLIASFESVKKEGLKVAEDANKMEDNLDELCKGMTAAIG